MCSHDSKSPTRRAPDNINLRVYDSAGDYSDSPYDSIFDQSGVANDGRQEHNDRVKRKKSMALGENV